ncbi:hypothetical protein ACFODQ_00665 [Comamonas sp. JC664]
MCWLHQPGPFPDQLRLGAKLDQLEVIARSKAAKLMMEHEMGEFSRPSC